MSGEKKSSWYAESSELEVLRQHPLTESIRADVCVVGAGIAGMSTAYLLSQEGKSVVVLDDGPVGGGMTGRTSAHLSCALDNGYANIEACHGREGARLAAESHRRAIDTIEAIARRENIDCQFTRVDGYLFNPPNHSSDNLQKELDAARRAGLDVEWVERAPMPDFDTGRCLRFPQQGQFHPLRYLAGLTRCLLRNGGRIFTQTHATVMQGGREAVVETAGGHRVGCSHLVVATNSPVNDRFFVHTKQAAYMSYVLALRLPAGSLPPSLYWDTLTAYHYVRIAPGGASDGSDLLLVGGEDHKVGQAHNFEERFRALEEWARQRFPAAGTVDYLWSGEVFEPVDFQAFIGRNPGDYPNVYVATGDSGHGLTHGTIAGLLITDLISGRSNPWEKLYEPSRISPWATGEFLRENFNTALQYRDWLKGGEVESSDSIPAGEGAVVRRGLQRLACYRDQEGKLHQMSAVCPHLQGMVRWNSAEKTWDCPCHGSRFDRFGRVVMGPANADLSPVRQPSETYS